jgi:hypothetical protein
LDIELLIRSSQRCEYAWSPPKLNLALADAGETWAEQASADAGLTQNVSIQIENRDSKARVQDANVLGPESTLTNV